ncbi:MAG: PstS family phosphate ABC transporter substrate-binding protein [Dongiaceae bacterium]
MKYAITLAALATLALAGEAQARDEIRIVGSSTVFPFSTAVAEQFGKAGSFKTPVVESTGTGGGIKLFCAGVGVEHPDITNASRKIKDSEIESCSKNGVTEITEVKIGFDGLTIANSKSSPPANFTLTQVFLALAKEVPQNGQWVANPHKNWSDIDPALPNVAIEVLGPPPTSGTRDSFNELVMEMGCHGLPEAEALQGDDKKAKCQTIREDGAYIEAGENDNLIVQKLEANANAFGAFGFSFLDQNSDKIQGSAIGGVVPSFESVADGSYPVSRSMYFYVKNQHVGVIPGIKEYVAEFLSDRASGEEGYLADKGLIPLPAGEREQVMQASMALTPMTN